MFYQSCRFLVVKIIFTLIVFSTTLAVSAQTQPAVPNDYRLNAVDGCFIKALKNRSYVDVPLSNFSNSKIHAVSHPRRPKYFAFKNAGVIHVIPKKCLVVWDTPEDELDGLNDIEETDDFEKYERLNKAASENRILNRIEVGSMKYFIEIGGGVNSFSDGKGGFDDKNLKVFGDILVQDNPGANFANLTDSKSKLDSKMPSAVFFKFGHRSDENSFWIYGFRRYSLKRLDTYVYSTALGPTTLDFIVQDQINEFSVGKRYQFDTKTSFMPFFDISLLLGSINQKMTGTDGTEADEKFDGSLLGLSIEGGVQFLLTRNVALKTSVGYNLYFLQRFRLKESEEESSNKGYESQFKYSNLSGSVGLAYYFK